MSDKIADIFNKHRIFPRFVAIVILYIFYQFHLWFTSVPITDIKEWAIVGYGTVLATVVGFAKFYMESGINSKS